MPLGVSRRTPPGAPVIPGPLLLSCIEGTWSILSPLQAGLPPHGLRSMVSLNQAAIARPPGGQVMAPLRAAARRGNYEVIRACLFAPDG